MQFGNECFCGERSLGDLKNHKIAEDRCNKNCPGDPSEKCGGYLTMNVYHTGSLPSKPGPSVLPQPGECLNNLKQISKRIYPCQLMLFQNIK